MPLNPNGIVWDAPHPDQVSWDDTQQSTNPLIDSLRAIPGGLAKGVAGIVGLPGDVQQLMNRGMDYLTGAHVADLPRSPLSPTSGDLNSAISAPFGGYYQPKTIPGQYTETAASFAPNALLPGSMAERAARVLVPSVASETAGQLTKGSSYEPIARAGGALLGGIGEGVGEAAFAPPQTAETIGTIKTAAGNAYKAVDNSGMQIAQPAMKDLSDQVSANLAKLGFDDNNIGALAPKTSAAVDSLENAATAPSSLQGLEMQRRIAGLASGAIDKTDRMAARVVQDTIDDFVQNITPQQVVGPIDQNALNQLGNARDLWGRAARAQMIQDTIDKAGNKFGGQSVFSPTLDQSLRTRFGTLANNARAMARFSPEEQQAISDVATGGNMLSARNLLSNVGRLSPQSVIPAMAEGAATVSNPYLAAIPATGFTARVGATAMTKSAANDALVAALMRGQALTQSPSAAQRFAPALLAAALANSGPNAAAN